MERLPKSAKMLIGAVAICGSAVLVRALWSWQHVDNVRFAAFLAVAVVAAMFKVKLPGMNSSMSVNMPFILLGVAELSLPEALLIGCASTLMQCLRVAQNRRNPVQIVFNVFTVANAAAVAWVLFNRQHADANFALSSLMMTLAAAGFLVANTVPVAAILSVVEQKNIAKVWRQMFLLTFPYYLLSAGVCAIVSAAGHYLGWQAPVVALPVMYAVYASYRHCFQTHLDAKAPTGAAVAAGH